MIPPAGRAGTWVLTLVALGFLAAAMAASPGFFLIDELIYYIGADALARTGRFTVDNGFEAFGSPALRVWLLVPGPDGLVPQYPAGNALVGAPLVALFGPRGLILLNAAAAGLAVFLCRALARLLYQDDRLAMRAALIFALATFLVEYALGIWPHALSVCLVLLASLAGARAVLRPEDRPLAMAFAAGLVVGAGVLFRADAVLILPPLAVWALLVARRPVPLLAVAAVGLVPGLLAAAALNEIKFGHFNPLSYGASGGGSVDIRGYAGLAVAGLGGLALLTLWRLGQGRPRVRRLAVVLAGMAAAALALAVVLVPSAHTLAGRFWHGAVALLVDATVITDPRPGVVPQADGTQAFWGLWKKALGQSAPWIGIVVFLAAVRWRAEDRPRHLLCLLVVALWALPFLMRAWHGGLSSNMRYLLPALPFLAMLAAFVWRELEARAAPVPGWIWPAGALAALALLAAVMSLHPAGFAAMHQIAPVWVLAAVAGAALLAALPGPAARPRAAGGLAALAAGLTTGALLGLIVDPLVAQARRGAIHEAASVFQALPERSLVYGDPAEAFAFQFERPHGLLAMPRQPAMTLDIDLVEAALEAGYRVFVSHPAQARRVLEAAPALSAEPAGLSSAGVTLLEVTRPAAATPEAPAPGS
jgi:hypothetical protein